MVQKGTKVDNFNFCVQIIKLHFFTEMGKNAWFFFGHIKCFEAHNPKRSQIGPKEEKRSLNIFAIAKFQNCHFWVKRRGEALTLHKPITLAYGINPLTAWRNRIPWKETRKKTRKIVNFQATISPCRQLIQKSIFWYVKPYI